eukprot:CAMPEP_0194071596 /NCGR_PEP_ID=MMETSP0009_2-20130614/88791_1 /TAXON_ID=210454 /ORGANISM="Grammatophora oceanica, Strain CCMP 410" /LENGTH=81 /DNA_ID=CAMNT_0038724929 /DNA_START=259 /DNA_END=504 /DNA_ORIENTATION=+
MIVPVNSLFHSAVRGFHLLVIERQIEPRELNSVDESSSRMVFHSAVRGFHLLVIERQIEPRELNSVDESSSRMDSRGAPHK